MKRNIALALALALSATGAAANSAGAVTYHPTLTIWPASGHSDSIIHLSGSGFPARRHLIISMICPSVQHPSAGNTEIVGGPVTGRHGRFKNFSFHALRLHGVKSTPCTIYGNVDAKMFAASVRFTLSQ